MTAIGSSNPLYKFLVDALTQDLLGRAEMIDARKLLQKADLCTIAGQPSSLCMYCLGCLHAKLCMSWISSRRGAEDRYRKVYLENKSVTRCSNGRYWTELLANENQASWTFQRKNKLWRVLLHHLVDKYMRQHPALNSGVRISRRLISRVWTLRKVEYS
jgi:hypothetical protein